MTICYVFHQIQYSVQRFTLIVALARTVCSKLGPEGVALHFSAASHAAGRQTTGGQQANHLKNLTKNQVFGYLF